MSEGHWLLYPVCSNKIRIKLFQTTILKNFPLYCPECKQENLINVEALETTLIREPDTKTQSQ